MLPVWHAIVSCQKIMCILSLCLLLLNLAQTCPVLTVQSPLSFTIILISSLTGSSDYVLKSIYQCSRDGFVPVGGNAFRSCSGSFNSSGQWTGSTPIDCQGVLLNRNFQ